MLNIYSDDTDSDLDYLSGTLPVPSQRHRFQNIVHRRTSSTLKATASTSNPSEVQAFNDTVASKQLGGKRVKDESKWKRNVLKKKRASGVEYVSKSGKTIPARVTGKNCQCKFGCFAKVPQNVQDDIIANFNKAADKNIQDMHLSGLISITNTQRRRPKTGEGQNRAYACRYKVKLGDFETTVCKKAFCSFHGIGKARVERIVKCLQEKKPFPKENRGKHDNRPTKIPQQVIDTIDEHIKSFPSEKSHYSSTKNDNVRYLSPDLNVKKMHRLYLQKYEPDVYALLEKGGKCDPTVSYNFYRRRFKTKYKLFFGTPRSDTCQQRDLLENQLKIEEDRQVARGVKFGISKYRYLEYNSNELVCGSPSASLLKDSFILEKINEVLPLPEADKKLYQQTLGLKATELKDVHELAKKYLPPDYLWFYNTLTEKVTLNAEEDEANVNDDDF